MASPSMFEWVLIAAGGGCIVYVMLNAIGRGAVVVASSAINDRRAGEAKRQAEDAAAEVAGRAAALEPLALKADGSIEEPILAMAEIRS